MKKLAGARVAIFGVGGVGGYVLEGLVRSGISKITLIDGDVVSESNINRQIIATRATVGMEKVLAAKARALEINPDAEINAINMFYTPENADEIDLSSFDYVVDAIDTIKSKIEIILRAKAAGIGVISSMGAGNKLDPTAFTVADIYKTSVCPLARVMRAELKKRGVTDLKVVYSKEEPVRKVVPGEERRHAPASISFVPSVVGLIIAGEVIKDIAFN